MLLLLLLMTFLLLSLLYYDGGTRRGKEIAAPRPGLRDSASRVSAVVVSGGSRSSTLTLGGFVF